ncbi:MAG: glutamate racemase [Candidatus Campbellbacteria bacterium]|nr:glutamate racemase [Candidatus Campbellbacteria bacterium]
MSTKLSKNKCIGVFDSGFGGITILRGIVRKLPEYNYLYVGDTARTPYGTRSKELVYEFTKQAVDFLFAHNCELIIFACNTASSDALRRIQREYVPKYYPHKKVLGVLIPAAEEAVAQTKNKRIGVVATSGTVQSGAFVREITKLDPKIQVFQNACPLLVPIVEEGAHNSQVTTLLLKGYLKPLITKNIDTLILGCTHYGILENKIRKICGSRITLISEGRVVPKKLKDYLTRHPKIERKISRNGTVRFYSTDLTPKFITLGSTFFGKKIKVQKITLQ